jgi:TatA/E family protein of Tat protein translocase
MGLSFSQIALIALVALLVIGPKRLPEVAKSLGKGYGEFKRTFGDFKKAVDMSDVTTSPKKQNAGTSSATYKSRWEEQANPSSNEAPASNASAEQQADTDKGVAASAAPIPEVAPVKRAKRGDLVKEDSNGSNG